MWDPIGSDSCRACQINSCTKMACDQIEGPYLEKENLQPYNEMKNNELSFYDNGNVDLCLETTSPPHCGRTSPSHYGRPLQEHDSNSQDSGYGASYHSEKFSTYLSPTRAATASFSSMCSMEDEFFDFSDVEPLEKPALPQDFNKLISNPLIPLGKSPQATSSNETSFRPVFRRALSLQNHFDNNTPNSSRVRTSLFKGEAENKSFKRPEPPNDVDMVGFKRSKMFDDDDCVPVARPLLQRAMSATEESIMVAVQRSSTEPDLIGDFSKNFCLPLTLCRHQDLKAITAHTLADLMKGRFKDTINSFKVIDCRYPYEFDGGHIEGALNLYTKEQCMELLISRQEARNNCSNERHVLVFHCEFSSERGPNLYRFLRKEDRNKNECMYPSLHYPEIYLLEGGYKKFFELYSDMCSPVAYKEMLHPDHEEELRHFRQKSKTWNCDSRRGSGKSFKRLGM